MTKQRQRKRKASRENLGEMAGRGRAEEALRESEERYRDLVENAADMIATYDQHGTVLFASPSHKRLLGYSPSELVGRNVLDLAHPDDRSAAADELAAILGDRAGIRCAEYRLRHKDGSWRTIESVGALLPSRSGVTRVVVSSRDVSERKEAEETIRHLAYHDTLTGLPNRALLIDRLQIALAQARRNQQIVAVMAMDLDRFKMVNDTAGHAVGDQLLQDVAHELAQLVREGDTVARFGGDEFTILLPQVNRSGDAVRVAERILEAMRRPKSLAGQEYRVTTSIGIATYPEDGADPDTLLRGADWAMYRAKDEGRDNCQICTRATAADLLQRPSLPR